MADKQAEDILVLDLRQVSLIADYFVLCSVGSERQLKSVSGEVQDQCDRQGLRPLHVEGSPESGWILLDYSSVIAHLFSPDVRAHYNLEELWKNAQVVISMK